MKTGGFGAEAEVDVSLSSREEMQAIAAALGPETMRPAGERAYARITMRGQVLKIRFSANDSSSLRAVMSSYLRMVRAAVNVCGSLLSLEQRTANGNTRYKVLKSGDKK